MLAALWVVFAVASVGVGFAAAGLVGDPFTDSGSDVVATGARPAFTTTPPGDASSGAASSGAATSSQPGAGSKAPATSSRPATGTRSPSHSSSGGGPTTGGSSGSTGSTGTGAGASTGTSTARGITTRAGYVSGTCRDGLIALNASPALGWRIGEITPGRTPDGSVHFAQTGGEGEVEVAARCVSGVPRFTLDDHRGGSGSGSGGRDDG